MLLLDNQLTFDLCCYKKFTSTKIKALHALHMKRIGGGLKITKKCEIPGYKYKLWFSKKAITNIVCLKNLIKCYWGTYDSEVDTSFVVHRSVHGLPKKNCFLSYNIQHVVAHHGLPLREIIFFPPVLTDRDRAKARALTHG